MPKFFCSLLLNKTVAPKKHGHYPQSNGIQFLAERLLGITLFMRSLSLSNNGKFLNAELV